MHRLGPLLGLRPTAGFSQSCRFVEGCLAAIVAVMNRENEQPPRGGAVTEVVQVGDTVRRSRGENAAFVQLLLVRFQAAG